MENPMMMIAIFGGVFGVILAVGMFLREMAPSAAEDRLAVLTGKKNAPGDGNVGGVVKKEVLQEGVSGVGNALGQYAERLGNVNLFSEQANSPFGLDVFLLLTVGAGALGFALAMAISAPFALWPIISLALAGGPYFWLAWQRKRRFAKFAKQMPDAMELIGRALRSGHSLASGLHVVVEEMPDPISSEFSQAYEQQNLGVPLEKALKTMLNRMPNLDLKFFVTAVAIQRQSGGDLAEVLDKIGYVVRERFKIIGQVQALTGEGRISGIVLMALPVGLFLTVYYLSPDYVGLLFTHPLGRKMSGMAIVLQLIGAYSIKKIIDIKI
ncbi:MAG: type II secretion system F family protein [Planctomycetaceae bacterium]|nr:type II secretion system F family protein [Planctomycetaceae bacterium]